jgi:alpha,alpha-trehalose phosphorylase
MPISPSLPDRALVTPDRFDAVLFDLDGVLTSTASLHAAAWKSAFDPLLAERGLAPFDEQRDYLHHVDGKPRANGVRDFLRSRGIALPEGTPGSPETERSVNGLANRKQAFVASALAHGGVEPFPGSVRWVEQLRGQGLRTAVVSASANCDRVLEAAEIASLFELTVDGRDVIALGLRGKPSPDSFLQAAAFLGVAPALTVVVEDALAGVAAGRAGRFGLVIGVARSAPPEALLAAGADVVVADLGELV